MSEKKQIVVVGAGLAGAPLANTLVKMNLTNVNITVIERRQASLIKYGGARAIVAGNSFSHRTVVSNRYLVPEKAGKVIHASVTSVDVANKTIKLDGDVSELKYDYLVLATGSQNCSATDLPSSIGTFKESQEYFQSVHEKIKAAKSILILGAGAVGTELVGEICEAYPAKKVSVANSGEHVLSGVKPPLPQKTITKLEEKMKQIGAHLYLGQRVEISLDEFGSDNTLVSEGKTYETSKGEKIEADLVIRCVGTKLNTAFLPDEWKDEQSQVKVNEFFQVVSGGATLENVFAIGDITNLAEAKMGYLGGLHAGKVAGNLKNALNNKDKKSWKKYVPGKDTKMAIPLGRSKGQAYFGLHMGNFLVSNIKGKDLFMTPNWKTFNMGGKLLKENDPKWEEKSRGYY